MVEVYVQVDPYALRQPDLETVLGEDAWWLPYRDYWSLFGATFEEATECFLWEREVLRRLPERTKEAEDRLLDELLEESEVDEGAGPSWGLDIGIGSTVLALSAAGCATLVSCSGHFGEGTWIQFPMVQFAADETRVEILMEAAEVAGCGMANTPEGLVEFWAPTIEMAMDFADQVIRRKDRFAGLSPAIVSSGEATDTQ